MDEAECEEAEDQGACLACLFSDRGIYFSRCGLTNQIHRGRHSKIGGQELLPTTTPSSGTID